MRRQGSMLFLFAAAVALCAAALSGCAPAGGKIPVTTSSEEARKEFLRGRDKAVAELQQANQQNPQNLYRLSLAYQGKGDSAKAKEFAAKAAGFNSPPQLNYAFVRTKAQKMSSDVKS